MEEGWPVILFIVSTIVQGKRTPKKIIITPLVSLAQLVEYRRIQWNKGDGNVEHARVAGTNIETCTATRSCPV